MPFEDFYEKSDKEKKRHWKSVVSTFALLVVVLISINGLYQTYEDYLTELTELTESAKESTRIKQIDAFCTNLPKPDLFNLVKRENPVSYNNNETEIVYRYQTERDSNVVIP